MFNSRIVNNVPRTILGSLSRLKNCKGDLLSSSALTLYSHLYSTYQLFGKNLDITHEEINSVINCKKTKCYKVITELLEFNLIIKHCSIVRNSTRRISNVFHISLLPPPPSILFQSWVRSTDFSSNLLPIRNVCLIEGEDEEITLKHAFISLRSDHQYESLLNELQVGDVIYFVAEPTQLEDGRWSLRNECNLMTEAMRSQR